MQSEKEKEKYWVSELAFFFISGFSHVMHIENAFIFFYFTKLVYVHNVSNALEKKRLQWSKSVSERNAEELIFFAGTCKSL